MPTEFTVHPNLGVVVSRGSGVFTHADFLDHMARVSADPQFHPDLNQIVDCRAITKMDLSHDQIKSLASRSIFSARSRRAFVVSSELHFGLTRMFAAYREIKAGQEVMVFDNPAAALTWLGIPADFDFDTAFKTSGA